MILKKEIKKIIIYIILLFPFFEPLSLRYLFPSFNVQLLFNCARSIVGLVFIVLYFYSRRQKISRSVFFIILFAFIYFFISLFTTIKLDYAFFFLSLIVGITCLFEIAVEKDKYTIIKALCLLLFVLTVINLICLILFPDGVIKYYIRSVSARSGEWFWDEYRRINFLEGDNAFMQFIMPLWTAAMILYNKKYLGFSQMLIILVVVNLNIIIIWSVTSLVGVAILDVMTVFIILGKKVLNFRKTIIILLVLDVLITIVSMTNKLSFSLTDLFGKDSTFTGRTKIWETAYNMFLASPIIGYGTGSSVYLIPFNGGSVAPHNLILAVLLQGGVLLFIPFCLYIYLCYFTPCNNSIYYQVILSGLLSYGIQTISETHFTTNGMWVFLALCNAICILIEKEQTNIDEFHSLKNTSKYIIR